MKISGHKIIAATPEITYGLLTDPAVLVRTMPGLKKLEPAEENSYTAEMEIGVAAIKGKYKGRMRVADAEPAVSYRLLMEGQGPGGFVSVNIVVTFAGQNDGTDVVYEGEAQIGGTIAGVGQRMLSGVANYLVNQFFTAVGKEAQSASPPLPEGQ
jgi:carbon monoxide dehydrogenase subunit G